MASFNPLREILQNLADEVESMNIQCLHDNVEMKAVKAELTNMENKKVQRRFLRCLGFVNDLEHDAPIFYQDKSSQVLDMIDNFRRHYDDLKRRYLWALNQLADTKLDLERITELHLQAEAENQDLFPTHEMLDGKQRGKENKTFDSGKQVRKNILKDRRVYTKATRSPKTIKIEDFPQMFSIVKDFENEMDTGDHIERSGVSNFKENTSQTQNTVCDARVEKNRETFDPALEAEYSLQIRALTEEIGERDRIIDSLESLMKKLTEKQKELRDQIKDKDEEIHRLMNNTHRY